MTRVLHSRSQHVLLSNYSHWGINSANCITEQNYYLSLSLQEGGDALHNLIVKYKIGKNYSVQGIYGIEDIQNLVQNIESRTAFLKYIFYL
jgi:hypothetical protein